MKAISLWQPYATAIAVGKKRIETRHWSTHYRGQIAIHAAKRWGGPERSFARTACAHGILPADIPRGVIVAIACLVDCKPTETLRPNDLERLFGNFDAGRFGWILELVEPLPQPVPFKGSQGFFEVPDDLIVRALEAAA